jgi:deoxyribonuclease V
MAGWPGSRAELEALQRSIASMRPAPWDPVAPFDVGGVFCAFSTAADPGLLERGWAAAVRGSARAIVRAEVEATYEAGYLALREGPLLERASEALGSAADVLLVNASGRDHPRGAGLAVHLGWVLGLPTVGVTDRPLVADVTDGRLVLGGEVVGYAVSTRPGVRPVLAHAGWRTSADVARSVIAAVTAPGSRTPEPLRRARFLARSARARDEGRVPPGWQMDRLVAPRFPGDG